MTPERFNEMLKEERDLAKAQIEDDVRQRFYHIINGRGTLIPRIAVKIAIDDIFGPEEPSILVDEDPLTAEDWTKMRPGRIEIGCRGRSKS